MTSPSQRTLIGVAVCTALAHSHAAFAIPSSKTYIQTVNAVAVGVKSALEQEPTVNNTCRGQSRVPDAIEPGMICAAYSAVSAMAAETHGLLLDIQQLESQRGDPNVQAAAAALVDPRPAAGVNNVYVDQRWVAESLRTLVRIQSVALMVHNGWHVQVTPQGVTIPNLTLAASIADVNGYLVSNAIPNVWANNPSLAERASIRQSQYSISTAQAHPQYYMVPLYGQVPNTPYAPWLPVNGVQNGQRPTVGAQLPAPPPVATLLATDANVRSAVQSLFVYQVPSGGPLWYSENNRGYTILTGGTANLATFPWLVIPRLEVEQEKFNRLWGGPNEPPVGQIHVNVQTLSQARHDAASGILVAAVWWTQPQPIAADPNIPVRPQIWEDGPQQTYINARPTGATALQVAANGRQAFDPFR